MLKEGQRWISESEPELGLGTLVQIEHGRVSILFPATGELRQYASDNAPIKRVQFKVGDQVSNHEDNSISIFNSSYRLAIVRFYNRFNKLISNIIIVTINIIFLENRTLLFRKAHLAV